MSDAGTVPEWDETAPAPAGDGDPLTVDEVIASLEAVRARYGGRLPVYLADGGPVVRVGVSAGGTAVRQVEPRGGGMVCRETLQRPLDGR
jgi:hypothetical protein